MFSSVTVEKGGPLRQINVFKAEFWDLPNTLGVNMWTPWVLLTGVLPELIIILLIVKWLNNTLKMSTEVPDGKNTYLILCH